MKNFLIIILFSLVLYASCSTNNVRTQNLNEDKTTISSPTSSPKAAAKEDCRICDFDFENYKGKLKKEEIQGLLLALDDEYKALATYEQINKDFGDPRPFVNIRRAEARHAERLKTIFQTYKVPVPENKWPGNVPKFQSVAEACQAGVEAEIANHNLYTEIFNSTKRTDIIAVYKALQSASEENHLPAFRRCGGR